MSVATSGTALTISRISLRSSGLLAGWRGRAKAGRPARSVADGKAGSDAVEQVRRRRAARRMGGAKRYPSNDVDASMGFAKGSTHPTHHAGKPVHQDKKPATM